MTAGILGRLLYTTGDTEGAVRYFLGLLREAGPHINPPGGLGLVTDDGSTPGKPASTDRVYLEDFRVALKHFKTTEQERFGSAALELPVRLSQPKETRLRLPGNAMEGDPERWKQLEEQWASFWRPRGKERLQSGGKAAVNGMSSSHRFNQHIFTHRAEPFWIDVVLRNPLNVEVTLSNLTVVVRDSKAEDPSVNADFVNVEVIEDLTLGARDSRTVSLVDPCCHNLRFTMLCRSPSQ